MSFASKFHLKLRTGECTKWHLHKVLNNNLKRKSAPTNNMHISELCLRCDCVDLAHVASLIFLLHIVYMQVPGPVFVVFVVRNADARISRYHVVMNCQDCRLLKVHPRYLQNKI